MNVFFSCVKELSIAILTLVGKTKLFMYFPIGLEV